jgi:hypothetical protein
VTIRPRRARFRRGIWRLVRPSSSEKADHADRALRPGLDDAFDDGFDRGVVTGSVFPATRVAGSVRHSPVSPPAREPEAGNVSRTHIARGAGTLCRKLNEAEEETAD